MHRRLALVSLLVALAPLPVAFGAPAGGITARPIPLDARDPARRDVGRLRWIGGWVLTGGDRRFGGISSMTLAGGRFTMLSDTGVVTRFRFAGTGRQRGVEMRPLPDGPRGSEWRKSARDSESSTRDPVTGRMWAAFETRNQVWRYTAGFAAADGSATPPAMAGWPENEGAEAMVRLRDGRFMLFAETRKRPDGAHEALLFPGDPVDGATPVAFGFRGPAGYAPTDAAELPDGRVLVLMRSFSPGRGIASGGIGFAAALVIVDPAAAATGGTIGSEPVATLAPPLAVDNMEALAVERQGARTIVWIASDDNFFALQRTLLLAFELRPAA